MTTHGNHVSEFLVAEIIHGLAALEVAAQTFRNLTAAGITCAEKKHSNLITHTYLLSFFYESSGVWL
jgi:hypothetical protein